MRKEVGALIRLCGFGSILREFTKGEKIAVVNPRPVHNFRKALKYENKTDLTDAQVLARYGEIKNLRLWEPPSPQIGELRDLVRRREELLKMIGQETCRRNVSSRQKNLASGG